MGDRLAGRRPAGSAGSAVAALRRYGVGDDDDVHTAADLAAKAARSAALDGRPLFAANRALDSPDEPVAKLWHAVTLLRESAVTDMWRCGRTRNLRPRSNVLHAAAGRVPKEFIRRSRDYDDEQWPRYRDRLIRRGLLDTDDGLTAAGSELKQRIEDTTDMLALSALDAWPTTRSKHSFRSLTPITRKVVSGRRCSPPRHRWA